MYAIVTGKLSDVSRQHLLLTNKPLRVARLGKWWHILAVLGDKSTLWHMIWFLCYHSLNGGFVTFTIIWCASDLYCCSARVCMRDAHFKWGALQHLHVSPILKCVLFCVQVCVSKTGHVYNKYYSMQSITRQDNIEITLHMYKTLLVPSFPFLATCSSHDP